MTKNFEVEETMFDRHDYMISVNYASDWEMAYTLREFIANAFDAHGEQAPVFSYDEVTGMARIEDFGQGLKAKDFLMGESSKAKSDVGQFGEGLKLSFNRLVAEDRKILLHTVGFSAVPIKFRREDFGEDGEIIETLSVELFKNTKQVGTIIEAEVTKKEYETAVNYFLKLRGDMKPIDSEIMIPGDKIFVAGVVVQDGYGTLFSYNCPKEFTNRDRNIIPSDRLNAWMEKVLSNTKSKEVAKTFLRAAKDKASFLEFNLDVLPANKDLWIEAIHEVWRNPVLSSDAHSDFCAAEAGYNIVSPANDKMRRLFEHLELETSRELVDQQKLHSDREIVYPISVDYMSTSKISRALQELISNASDTGTKTSFSQNRGIIKIVDEGTGILPKHLYLGQSDGTEQTIGTFGEGLKLACLILARENRAARIESVGYTYEPVIVKRDGLAILKILIGRNMNDRGTIISLKGTPNELNRVLGSDYSFNNEVLWENDKLQLLKRIPNCPTVFVNGLALKPEDFSLSSSKLAINLKSSSLYRNREKDRLDIYDAAKYIAEGVDQDAFDIIIKDLVNIAISNKDIVGHSRLLATRAIDQMTYTLSEAAIAELSEKIKSKSLFARANMEDVEVTAIESQGYREVRISSCEFLESIFGKKAFNKIIPKGIDIFKKLVESGDVSINAINLNPIEKDLRGIIRSREDNSFNKGIKLAFRYLQAAFYTTTKCPVISTLDDNKLQVIIPRKKFPLKKMMTFDDREKEGLLSSDYFLLSFCSYLAYAAKEVTIASQDNFIQLKSTKSTYAPTLMANASKTDGDEVNTIITITFNRKLPEDFVLPTLIKEEQVLKVSEDGILTAKQTKELFGQDAKNGFYINGVHVVPNDLNIDESKDDFEKECSVCFTAKSGLASRMVGIIHPRLGCVTNTKALKWMEEFFNIGDTKNAKQLLESNYYSQIIEKLCKSVKKEDLRLLAIAKESSPWKHAFHQIYGEKIAVNDCTYSDRELLEKNGFTLLENKWSKLATAVGVPLGSQLASIYGVKYAKITPEDLNPIERDIYNASVKGFLENLNALGEYYPLKDIHLVEFESSKLLGLCTLHNNHIFIGRRALSSQAKSIGTLNHEYIHAKTHFHDGTLEFEHALTEFIGRLSLLVTSRNTCFYDEKIPA